MEWSQLMQINSNSQEGRSNFERDYDRIIFSFPFRILQNKTQVMPLPQSELIHSRLLHSLECSSVGRSIGHFVGTSLLQRHQKEFQQENISNYDFADIVRAACLAHDIGNPPFGHMGESSIAQFYKDFLRKNPGLISDRAQRLDLESFEGNAQGFRLLSKKISEASGISGLGLTANTRLAFTKYPRSSLPLEQSKRCDQKKYGFFQSEEQDFIGLAKDAGLISLEENSASFTRHPLAYLVEAADDICYLIMDLEDGVRSGFISNEAAKDQLKALLAKSFRRPEYDLVDKTKQLEYLRGKSINKLIADVQEAFMEFEEQILAGTWSQALLEQLSSSNILRAIRTLSKEKIYENEMVLAMLIGGSHALKGLLSCFSEALFEDRPNQEQRSLLKILPPLGQGSKFNGKLDNYKKLLFLNDFISSLSDKNLLEMYRRIEGIQF